MRIRKFTAAAAAGAVLATTAILAPAASALTLEVEGDVCTIEESYEGELNDLQSGPYLKFSESLDLLRELLPQRAEDINLIMEGTAPLPTVVAAQARIEEAAAEAGLGEYEIASLNILFLFAQLQDIDPEDLPVIDDAPEEDFSYFTEPFTRAEAAENIEQITEVIEAYKQEILIVGPEDDPTIQTSSAPGAALAAPVRDSAVATLEFFRGTLQACVDGESGEYLFEAPPTPPTPPVTGTPGDNRSSGDGFLTSLSS